MKTPITQLFIVLLITLVAAPALASRYQFGNNNVVQGDSAFDTSGTWDISLDLGKTIRLGSDKYNINTLSFSADITQTNNRFTFTSLNLFGSNDTPLSIEGQIKGAKYIFDQPLTFEMSLGELTDADPNDPTSVYLTLDFFWLTDRGTSLNGAFDAGLDELNPSGAVCFTGEENAVPVPAAAWLLGSGVFAMFCVRRKPKA